MSTRFNDCLEFVLRWEGGLVDDPADRGGATNRGITQETLDKFNEEHGLDGYSVRDISAESVSDIYRINYWLAAHCEQMPAPVDLVVFDAAVQHGAPHAIRFLQAVLGVEQDGKWGPKTAAALSDEENFGAIADGIIDERRKFYQAIVAHDPRQERFANGWANRCDALEKAIA